MLFWPLEQGDDSISFLICQSPPLFYQFRLFNVSQCKYSWRKAQTKLLNYGINVLRLIQMAAVSCVRCMRFFADICGKIEKNPKKKNICGKRCWLRPSDWAFTLVYVLQEARLFFIIKLNRLPFKTTFLFVEWGSYLASQRLPFI